MQHGLQIWRIYNSWACSTSVRMGTHQLILSENLYALLKGFHLHLHTVYIGKFIHIKAQWRFLVMSTTIKNKHEYSTYLHERYVATFCYCHNLLKTKSQKVKDKKKNKEIVRTNKTNRSAICQFPTLKKNNGQENILEEKKRKSAQKH